MECLALDLFYLNISFKKIISMPTRGIFIVLHVGKKLKYA